MQNTQHRRREIAKLALALDVGTDKEAYRILEEIEQKNIVVKVGYSLFIKYGVDIVRRIKEEGFEIFLDLKLHDIPNTVYNGVLSATQIGVDYLTVHTLGGEEMLERAIEAKKNSNLKLLGVTLLTSHTDSYMEFLGSRYSIEEMVLKLANTAIEKGIDGIVCSTEEVENLKKRIGKDFIAVVPGIRPEGFPSEDQKRVATPKDAIKKGADIIVIGRPIIKSDNKNEILKKVLEDIQTA